MNSPAIDRLRFLAFAATLVLHVAPAPAAAGGARQAPPPIYLAQATPSPAAADRAPARTAHSAGVAPALALDAGAPSTGGVRLVEVPQLEGQGASRRPRYALGFRSETMRAWLNDIGLEATSCLAPVVRLRSKISSEGDISGSLWLYVRCSLR